MPTKVTLSISLVLIVCIPWYIFWLAGERERAEPTVFIESVDRALAIEIEENALLADSDAISLRIAREAFASVISVDGSLVDAEAKGRLIMKREIYSDTVALPLVVQKVGGIPRVIQDVFYDVDYKTGTIWVVASLQDLSPVYVLDGEALSFSYTDSTMRYLVDEEGLSSWALATNLLPLELSVGTVSLAENIPISVGTTSTTTYMHIGFSEEVEPSSYELPYRDISPGLSYTASSTFTCVSAGEFDWYLRPALPITYGVRFVTEGGVTTSVIQARISARIFSKCEKKED